MIYKNRKALKSLVCLIWLLFLTVFTFGSNNCIDVKDVKNLIKIPMLGQGTKYTCGVTALQSVLLYYYRNE